MCLIVRGTVGNLLALDLQRAQMCNSDGWGIHTSRDVHYSFTSGEPDIVKYLQSLRKSTMVTIHFRFATHGDVNVMNAHPFHLGDDEFLMHNGVLHGEHFQHKKKSDTMRLAEILADAGRNARDYILDSLTETEWYSNKFCLLNGKNWKKFGDWTYDKPSQTWHSNRSILGGTTHIPTAKTTSGAGNVLMWDRAEQAWVPKTPPAAVTRGCMYDYDDEVAELDGLTEKQIEDLFSEYVDDVAMGYIDADTDVADELVDAADPFYIGRDQ